MLVNVLFHNFFLKQSKIIKSNKPKSKYSKNKKKKQTHTHTHLKVGKTNKQKNYSSSK